MDEKIQPAPARRNLAEQGLDAARIGDIAGEHMLHRRQRIAQGAHPLLQRAFLIAQRQPGAAARARRGDAPGDGALVGDAHDQAALAVHERRRGGRRRPVHGRSGARRIS